jgi:hypothetical protein
MPGSVADCGAKAFDAERLRAQAGLSRRLFIASAAAPSRVPFVFLMMPVVVMMLQFASLLWCGGMSRRAPARRERTPTPSRQTLRCASSEPPRAALVSSITWLSTRAPRLLLPFFQTLTNE